MKIRKQVHELMPDDLHRFPIWEYTLDEESEEGQDEATVRPHKIIGPLDLSEDSFIIRANFTLADGTQMRGYLTPTVRAPSSVRTLQPVIVTERGQVGFWCGVVTPEPSHLAQDYEKLGRTVDKVFPVHVVSDVDLIGGPVSAEIRGFMTLVYETGATIETK